MAQPVMVIVSKDEDFAAVLAEQASRELKVIVEIAASAADARAHMEKATVLVATEPVADAGRIPVIDVRQRNRPLKMNELLADIRYALAHPGEGDAMPVGKEYQFALRQKTVTHAPSGKAVTLTDKEAQLLAALARASGQVARENLLKTVWGVETELESHTLETHVYRLRAKLRDIGLKDAIAAVEGGYVWAVK